MTTPVDNRAQAKRPYTTAGKPRQPLNPEVDLARQIKAEVIRLKDELDQTRQREKELTEDNLYLRQREAAEVARLATIEAAARAVWTGLNDIHTEFVGEITPERLEAAWASGQANPCGCSICHLMETITIAEIREPAEAIEESDRQRLAALDAENQMLVRYGLERAERNNALEAAARLVCGPHESVGMLFEAIEELGRVLGERD